MVTFQNQPTFIGYFFYFLSIGLWTATAYYAFNWRWIKNEFLRRSVGIGGVLFFAIPFIRDLETMLVLTTGFAIAGIVQRMADWHRESRLSSYRSELDGKEDEIAE